MQPSDKPSKPQTKFFIGNGISTRDLVKATNKLMHRDHDKILQLFQDYFNGKLGTYFVPPVFFSGIPEVIKPSQYDAKTNSDGKYKDKIKGDTAERVAFESLKKYYEKTGDDVIVVHSHLFLADANEKDFVVFNLSKGYMMIIETKSTAGIGMY